MSSRRMEQFKDLLDSVFRTEIAMFRAWYHKLTRKIYGKIALRCMAKVSKHKNREYELRREIEDIFDCYTAKYSK